MCGQKNASLTDLGSCGDPSFCLADRQNRCTKRRTRILASFRCLPPDFPTTSMGDENLARGMSASRHRDPAIVLPQHSPAIHRTTVEESNNYES